VLARKEDIVIWPKNDVFEIFKIY